MEARVVHLAVLEHVAEHRAVLPHLEARHLVHVHRLQTVKKAKVRESLAAGLFCQLSILTTKRCRRVLLTCKRVQVDALVRQSKCKTRPMAACLPVWRRVTEDLGIDANTALPSKDIIRRGGRTRIALNSRDLRYSMAHLIFWGDLFQESDVVLRVELHHGLRRAQLWLEDLQSRRSICFIQQAVFVMVRLVSEQPH